jgi:hypothetical protein
VQLNPATPRASALVPDWDHHVDQLRLQPHWVSTIPRKATAMRALLDQIEESLWADEVLLNCRRKRAYEQAHNAVKRLNRKLAKFSPRLLLRWNGRATGICWRILEAPANDGTKQATESDRSAPN